MIELFLSKDYSQWMIAPAADTANLPRNCSMQNQLCWEGIAETQVLLEQVKNESVLLEPSLSSSSGLTNNEFHYLWNNSFNGRVEVCYSLPFSRRHGFEDNLQRKYSIWEMPWIPFSYFSYGNTTAHSATFVRPWGLQWISDSWLATCAISLETLGDVGLQVSITSLPILRGLNLNP